MEGVIKFGLDFRRTSPLQLPETGEISAWRNILWRLGLIGQDPDRYGGLGFGNISHRLSGLESASGGGPPFLISGTQTGGVRHLGPEHFALVTECRPEENRVSACGPVPPSSEALTHGAIYGIAEDVRWVAHVHSPEIWRARLRMGIACTEGSAEYGTPALAREIRRLILDPAVKGARIFAMDGHQDGLVSFGREAEEVVSVLVAYLGRALQQNLGE